jgi:hypothetical protein
MVSARRSKKMHCFINGAAITRMRILAIAAVALFCSAAAATPPLVTFVSPCSCHNVHGKGRWSVKHDPSTPPTDASAIQAVSLFGLSVISVVPYAGCFRTQTAVAGNWQFLWTSYDFSAPLL